MYLKYCAKCKQYCQKAHPTEIVLIFLNILPIIELCIMYCTILPVPSRIRIVHFSSIIFGNSSQMPLYHFSKTLNRFPPLQLPIVCQHEAKVEGLS